MQLEYVHLLQYSHCKHQISLSNTPPNTCRLMLCTAGHTVMDYGPAGRLEVLEIALLRKMRECYLTIRSFGSKPVTTRLYKWQTQLSQHPHLGNSASHCYVIHLCMDLTYVLKCIFALSTLQVLFRQQQQIVSANLARLSTVKVAVLPECKFFLNVEQAARCNIWHHSRFTSLCCWLWPASSARAHTTFVFCTPTSFIAFSTKMHLLRKESSSVT